VGWEKCSNQRYPEFGSQRSWRRILKEEPVVEQLEFPVIDDADIPAEWE
jgi:hypothetical protein